MLNSSTYGDTNIIGHAHRITQASIVGGERDPWCPNRVSPGFSAALDANEIGVIQACKRLRAEHARMTFLQARYQYHSLNIASLIPDRTHFGPLTVSYVCSVDASNSSVWHLRNTDARQHHLAYAPHAHTNTAHFYTMPEYTSGIVAQIVASGKPADVYHNTQSIARWVGHSWSDGLLVDAKGRANILATHFPNDARRCVCGLNVYCPRHELAHISIGSRLPMATLASLHDEIGTPIYLELLSDNSTSVRDETKGFWGAISSTTQRFSLLVRDARHSVMRHFRQLDIDTWQQRYHYDDSVYFDNALLDTGSTQSWTLFIFFSALVLVALVVLFYRYTFAGPHILPPLLGAAQLKQELRFAKHPELARDPDDKITNGMIETMNDALLYSPSHVLDGM